MTRKSTVRSEQCLRRQDIAGSEDEAKHSNLAATPAHSRYSENKSNAEVKHCHVAAMLAHPRCSDKLEQRRGNTLISRKHMRIEEVTAVNKSNDEEKHCHVVAMPAHPR